MLLMGGEGVNLTSLALESLYATYLGSICLIHTALSSNKTEALCPEGPAHFRTAGSVPSSCLAHAFCSSWTTGHVPFLFLHP